MPSVKWNMKTWDSAYDWNLKGEEWSHAWGSSEAQWFGSIYPRIHRCLAAENILEIACGYGRWTKFLLHYTISNYRGVDLSKECITYCEKTFDNPKASFYKNDGSSLDLVNDLQYDFIFSFDSLVHVDVDILDTYIMQIVELLSDDGICFLHHTNFGGLIDKGLVSQDSLGYTHMRDQSSSQEKIASIIDDRGGAVLIQEIIDWGGVDQLDCLTMFTKKTSTTESTSNTIINSHFMKEAEIIKNYQNYYSEGLSNL